MGALEWTGGRRKCQTWVTAYANTDRCESTGGSQLGGMLCVRKEWDVVQAGQREHMSAFLNQGSSSGLQNTEYDTSNGSLKSPNDFM